MYFFLFHVHWGTTRQRSVKKPVKIKNTGHSTMLKAPTDGKISLKRLIYSTNVVEPTVS